MPNIKETQNALAGQYLVDPVFNSKTTNPYTLYLEVEGRLEEYFELNRVCCERPKFYVTFQETSVGPQIVIFWGYDSPETNFYVMTGRQKEDWEGLWLTLDFWLKSIHEDPRYTKCSIVRKENEVIWVRIE